MSFLQHLVDRGTRRLAASAGLAPRVERLALEEIAEFEPVAPVTSVTAGATVAAADATVALRSGTPPRLGVPPGTGIPLPGVPRPAGPEAGGPEAGGTWAGGPLPARVRDAGPYRNTPVPAGGTAPPPGSPVPQRRSVEAADRQAPTQHPPTVHDGHPVRLSGRITSDALPSDALPSDRAPAEARPSVGARTDPDRSVAPDAPAQPLRASAPGPAPVARTVRPASPLRGAGIRSVEPVASVAPAGPAVRSRQDAPGTSRGPAEPDPTAGSVGPVEGAESAEATWRDLSRRLLSAHPPAGEPHPPAGEPSRPAPAAARHDPLSEASRGGGDADLVVESLEVHVVVPPPTPGPVPHRPLTAGAAAQPGAWDPAARHYVERW